VRALRCLRSSSHEYKASKSSSQIFVMRQRSSFRNQKHDHEHETGKQASQFSSEHGPPFPNCPIIVIRAIIYIICQSQYTYSRVDFFWKNSLPVLSELCHMISLHVSAFLFLFLSFGAFCCLLDSFLFDFFLGRSSQSRWLQVKSRQSRHSRQCHISDKAQNAPPYHLLLTSLQHRAIDTDMKCYESRASSNSQVRWQTDNRYR
jgi:hypothetical protein